MGSIAEALRSICIRDVYDRIEEEHLRWYRKLMSLRFEPTDCCFQILFTSFYVVRRNRCWKEEFYKYYGSLLRKKVTFDEIIVHLYDSAWDGQKRVELSFSSKMFATIYTDKPIWDANVAKVLGLRMPPVNDPQERLRKAKEIYHCLENKLHMAFCPVH